MDLESAFLAAIQADPYDLTLPLVYADWLEEQGDVRAELIRVRRALEETLVPDRRTLELLEYGARLSREIDPDWLKLMGYDAPVQIAQSAPFAGAETIISRDALGRRSQQFANAIRTRITRISGSYDLVIRGTPRIPKLSSQAGREIFEYALEYCRTNAYTATQIESRLFTDRAGSFGIAKISLRGRQVRVRRIDATE